MKVDEVESAGDENGAHMRGDGEDDGEARK